jgi:hypothetical protein
MNKNQIKLTKDAAYPPILFKINQTKDKDHLHRLNNPHKLNLTVLLFVSDLYCVTFFHQ